MYFFLFAISEVQATMRAWLSVIAVLATFQIIVQVASTEDLSLTTPLSYLSSSTPSSSIISSSPSSLLSSSTTTITTKTTISSLSDKQNPSKQQQHSMEDKEEVNEFENNDEINETIRIKPDPSTQIEIEKNLMSLFGMKSRPMSIDRSKAIIPDALKQLYVQITGQEYRESVNLPKPGLFTKSANTVRSFLHEG